jgi:uncharacterized protein (DUF488 family)
LNDWNGLNELNANEVSPMSCASPRAVHTIGHSTRPIETFLALLKTHAIEMVVDVRRWPMSRRHPQFSRETLAASLKENGIDYLWRGDLGGFRKPEANSPNTAWRVGTFRAYADFMLTAEFEGTMADVEKLAANDRIALMCAEAVPWRCHRQLLADAFVVRGWSVRHIMDDGCHEHKLPPFAQPEGTRLFYRESL